MIISHVVLKNWRNFQKVDVSLRDRVFLIGPNAAGKSNFLDAFRFLRDVAKAGGGLQKAIEDRGGLSRIRCLAARRTPSVEIEVGLAETPEEETKWRYAIGIIREKSGKHTPILSYEKVWAGQKLLLNRPDQGDKDDPKRLTETHLEQTSANRYFRDVSDFLNSIQYLHLVPQLLRHPEAFPGPEMPGDPYGKKFMERVARTPDRTRQARLKKIENALQVSVPQLDQLSFVKDETGIPHLEAVYKHWRPKAGKQREDQFSDGTLRLIGLFWSLLDSDSLLLLEEPELSLNVGIVSKLAPLVHKLQRERKRQVILSTHSPDLLADKGIEGDEVLILFPSREGTEVRIASSIDEIRALLEGGMSMADAVTPSTIRQITLDEMGL